MVAIQRALRPIVTKVVSSDNGSIVERGRMKATMQCARCSHSTGWGWLDTGVATSVLCMRGGRCSKQ